MKTFLISIFTILCFATTLCQTIDVKAKYKIVADGKTDNAAVLMNMQKDLAGKGKPHVTLLLPPGEIRYSNNRWLYGIYSFELIGNNTTLHSIYSGTDNTFQRPISVGEMFQNNTLSYIGTKLYQTASLFLSSSPGSSSITLSNFADTIYFPAGDRILLYAGNYADYGYPPASSAEWNEIASRSGKILFLQRPLEKNYPENIWDNPVTSGGGSGKPRIINLDRKENIYCKSATFKGITFDGDFVFPAEELILDHCKVKGWTWPSENKTATYNYCDLLLVEFDKLVGTVSCNHTIIHGSANGGGSIDNIILNDCEVANSIRFDSRYVTLNNVSAIADIDPDMWTETITDYPARNPIRRFIIGGLKLSSTTASKSFSHINIAPFNSMQIVNTLGKAIVTQNFDLVKTIEPGTTVLFEENGTDGGIVDSITPAALGNFLIWGRWSNPQAGQVWRWSQVAQVIDQGDERVLDNKKMWNGAGIRWKGNQAIVPPYTMHLTEQDFKWPGNITVDCYCFIESVDYYQSKPGVGEISIEDPETNFNFFEHKFENQWVKQLTLNAYNLPASFTASDIPKFDIIIKWRPF